MTNSALLILTLVAGQSAVAAEKTAHDSSRWESAVTRFEQQDTQQAPPQHAILFVGSSSIRMWDLPKYFPDRRVINRGFGGSQMADVVNFAQRIVIKHRPRVVVVYSGDNDVTAGKSAEEVHEDYLALVEKVRTALPETKIVCIAIKPSIARWQLRETMRAANGLISDTCAEEDLLEFVDVWPAMLDAQGLPRRDLFLDDGLHMNHEGYAIWADLVRDHLDE